MNAPATRKLRWFSAPGYNTGGGGRALLDVLTKRSGHCDGSRRAAFHLSDVFWVFVAAAVVVATGCEPAGPRSQNNSFENTAAIQAQPSELSSSKGPVIQPAGPSSAVGGDTQGVGGRATGTPTEADQGGRPGAVEPSATAGFQPVRLASWSDIQKFVSQQKGKIVVLDLWSTSCGPCMRELPHLVGLQKELKDAVVGATVSLDYYGDPDSPPESYREKVEPFLRRIEADLTNFLCTDPDQTVFTQLQMASIPIVLVYDAEGRLAKAFNNDRNEYGQEGFTYQKHVIPFVKSLLGSAAEQQP